MLGTDRTHAWLPGGQKAQKQSPNYACCSRTCCWGCWEERGCWALQLHLLPLGVCSSVRQTFVLTGRPFSSWALPHHPRSQEDEHFASPPKTGQLLNVEIAGSGGHQGQVWPGLKGKSVWNSLARFLGSFLSILPHSPPGPLPLDSVLQSWITQGF